MDHRSPLENIFNIIGGLPQGHDKPIKHALYNAVALFLLFICTAALCALYLILEPFIKPLIWALLVGSVMHPVKHNLAHRFKLWFTTLEESHTPIIIGLALIPVNIVNNLSEFIGSNMKKYWKIIILVIISFGAMHLLYFYTPGLLLQIIVNTWSCISYVLFYLIDNTTTTFIVATLIAYIFIMAFMWTPGNNKKFHYASMLVWLLLSCFVAKQFGKFQIPVFVLLQIVLVTGFIFEFLDIQEELNLTGKQFQYFVCFILLFSFANYVGPDYSFFDCLKITLQGKDRVEIKRKNSDDISDKKEKYPWSLELFEDKLRQIQGNTSLLITDKGKVHIIQKPSVSELPKVRRSHSQPSVGGLSFKNRGLLNWRRSSNIAKPSNGELSSDFYIYSLLWACGVMFFWKNIMFVPILTVPILIYIIKHVGYYLSVWSWLNNYMKKVTECVSTWYEERYDAIVPVPIRGLCRIINRINRWLKSSVKDSIDTVASCVVIAALIIFVVCASVFIFVQIYAEAIILVQMTSNVINQTVVHNPELRQLLPPTFDNTVDSILDNAYQYGREGISKAIRSMMNGVDPTKSEKLEKQVLELWDRIYQTWMSSDDDHGPKVTADAVQKSWNNFIDDLQKSPEMFNLNGIISFINQNVGTLLSLLESIWGIVKGNISLVLGSFSAILSVVLGGGTAVLNFILNMIIFLTTLFYLLSSSGELYKPVELMTQFSTNGNRFGLALGDAINGVFTASFKMATFYGLWTWFIHNLFGVKIVYLPSAVATILAVAPFLGTYWACVPAVFDLWLAQSKSVQAILFAAVQFIPMSIVDATIYAEIKGGHPYLTGLAIAGGIFCLGLEGAIIGPLVLCGLYVAVDLSTTLFKESPSEESINLHELSR